MAREGIILHVIESLKTGGAQKLLSDLLPALKRDNRSVRLIVAKRELNALEKKIETAGIEIIDMGCDSVKSPGFYRSLRRYLKAHHSEISLIHVHLFPTLYIVPTAARYLEIPLVYTEHSTHNKRRDKSFLQPLEKYAYSRYSRIIGISEDTSLALGKWIGEEGSERIVTIPNGVDLTPFSQNPKQNSHITGAPVILMVSRFVPAKDQETVIKCIPLVKDRTAMFHFAGDGETLEYHKRKAEEVGVKDRCVFHGNVENVADLMKEAAIGVQSSHWEGFGLTAVEFMASGVPVIASDVPGLNEVVKDAGLLFKPGNPADLAECIDRLLSNENDINAELKNKGIVRSRQYGIDKMVESLENVYSEVKKL